jgi:hypothetical protein
MKIYLKKMSNIYCGNNLFELQTSGRRVGTSYECLKKGIGYGLHMDLSDFNPNYRAIIADNTYCGNGTPPPGKITGTPTSCLRKGIGIGKKLQYDRRGIIPPSIWSDSPNPTRERPSRRFQFVQSEFLFKWWPLILAVLVGVIATLFKANLTNVLLCIILTLITCWIIKTILNI